MRNKLSRVGQQQNFRWNGNGELLKYFVTSNFAILSKIC